MYIVFGINPLTVKYTNNVTSITAEQYIVVILI